MASFITQAWNRLRGKPQEVGNTSANKMPAAAPVADASVARVTQRHGVTPAGLGARRPVISVGGGVEGFEFRIHQDLFDRFKRAPNLGAQAAYATAVLTSARPR